MYDYATLRMDIDTLTEEYPVLEIGSIGKSVKGRNLYLIKLGRGENKIFYNGAHHGQEWVTSWILMRFIFDYVDAMVYDRAIDGTYVQRIFNEYSIYIVPMVNPDGVEIGKTDSDWQANANGVDLNHNYDAKWQEGKFFIAREYGIIGPGPTRWSGRYPESEPESKAVADFTRNNDFTYVIAWHSQGEEIYYKYDSHIPPGGLKLAEEFARESGYKLADTVGSADYSGYKDWFIKEFDKPGFTIEVGLGTNPLPESQFEGIYTDVLEILLPHSV